MAKPIFTTHRWESADQTCCWPSCLARRAEISPLCRKHMIKTWQVVANEVRSILDHRKLSDPQPRMQGNGWVYFVRFQDRIKIGWTGNLDQRLAAIPHDEVLAIVPGTMTDEKRCHAAFAHLRENGEWFRTAPDLLSFIADIKS